VQTELPNAQLLVPDDGAIVGWGVSGAHGEIALSVIRPGGTETTRVLRSQFEFAPNDAPTYFRTRLPVERGDLIGIELGRGASVGVGSAGEATTDRWVSPRGGAFGLPDGGDDTRLDRELLLRADFRPGAKGPAPQQLTGQRAADAPAGTELDRDRMRIFEPRLKVDVALVQVDNRVVLDLFNDGERAARIYMPGLVPNGLPYDLKAIDYPGEGYGEADVWWVNPKAGRLVFHHMLVYPRRFVFFG
jgi:hypothetical protein